MTNRVQEHFTTPPTRLYQFFLDKLNNPRGGVQSRAIFTLYDATGNTIDKIEAYCERKDCIILCGTTNSRWRIVLSPNGEKCVGTIHEEIMKFLTCPQKFISQGNSFVCDSFHSRFAPKPTLFDYDTVVSNTAEYARSAYGALFFSATQKYFPYDMNSEAYKTNPLYTYLTYELERAILVSGKCSGENISVVISFHPKNKIFKPFTIHISFSRFKNNILACILQWDDGSDIFEILPHKIVSVCVPCNGMRVFLSDPLSMSPMYFKKFSVL